MTATPTPMGPAFWRRMQALRGLLATYVVFHHIRQKLWPSHELFTGPAHAAGAVFGTAFGYGHHAVLVFFVISGASIHARWAQRANEEEPFDVKSFFLRRARRILPALWLSLALSAVLGTIAGTELTVLDLVGTLLFQQTIFTREFAGNVPYWSLAFEEYFYFLYPMFTMLRQARGRFVAFALAMGTAFALGFVPQRITSVLCMGTVWLTGALWFELTLERGKLPRWVGALTGASFAGALAYYYFFGFTEETSTWVWSLLGMSAVGPLELWMRSNVMERVGPRVARGLDELGKMSFSVYLNHYLIILVIAKFVPPNPASLGPTVLASVGALAATLLVAWLSARYVEAPFLLARPAAPVAVETAPR